MSIESKIKEFEEIFRELHDKRARLEFLHDLSLDFEKIPGCAKEERFLKTYCSSPFYLKAGQENGLVKYAISSEGITPRGLLSLLFVIFDGEKLEDIQKTNKDLSRLFGFEDLLSAQRLIGFKQMQADFIKSHNS